MGRYAPGTMGFDLANNAGGRRQRRMADIASGLEGLGGLFGTLAGINQRMQAQADQQAAMPYLARAYADPFDRGQPGVYGPQRPVMQEAMDTAATQQQPSFWGNVGSAFGFGERQGRIGPGTLGQIGAIQQRGQDQAMQVAQQNREAEMQPFRVAEARNTIRQQDTNYQQDVEEFPMKMDAAKTAARAATQKIAQGVEEFQMRREKNAAEIKYLEAGADARQRGTGGGAARPDVLGGKIRDAALRAQKLGSYYALRQKIDNGTASKTEKSAYLMNGDPSSKLDAQTLAAQAQIANNELTNLQAQWAQAFGDQPVQQFTQPQEESVQPVTAESVQQGAPSQPAFTQDQATFMRKYVKAQGWDPNNITPEQEAELKAALGRQGEGGR